ncbi:winged helix-turn-helix domain-containing protein [Paremcibacter congregatus]|uniref:winged helix-turn-helix domain-containing protein n=1 Tax=Paremcibacter congregatus TaxID=2043170 RepID=UPI0030EEDA56|tara:strand:+ start:1034 stop:2203 length:1170 start_codon:yes stop_codon:yes gene_type:complete
MALRINNRDMRRLWLETNGLAGQPSGAPDPVQIIKKLGFVQLDTIQNVSRAHHHILWSRNEKYREPMLDELLRSKQDIFEHFTHDASVLPMDFYPVWQRKFRKIRQKTDGSKYYEDLKNSIWQDEVKSRIAAEGPLSTRDFDSKIKGEKKMWSRPPHKQVLDYLWYVGELSTSHRENFQKFYDLSERVIPHSIRTQVLSDQEQLEGLCHAALSRLVAGSLKEIKNFWEAKEIKEVKTWVDKSPDQIIPVEWETASGSYIKSFALNNIEERLQNISPISSRMRIINPFDPAVRDRTRLKHMFGFDYKIEIFVPAAQRRWGYYVYPLLEGERFVGRIEVKADRKAGCLNVLNFWAEEGIKWGAGRHQKLDRELLKFANLVNIDKVIWIKEK